MNSIGDGPRSVVAQTIYKATLALDDQKWDDWLELCAEDFNYAIKAFSPEINKDMTYLEHGRPGMKYHPPAICSFDRFSHIANKGHRKEPSCPDQWTDSGSSISHR